MTIVLKPETERIISERVRSGRYRDAAEVLERALALLREMDEREDRVEALLQEGLDSGPSVEMTAADWDEIRREVHGSMLNGEPDESVFPHHPKA